MIEFTLKDGTQLRYENPFIFEDNYLIKTRVVRDGDGEGPWAWIHPDDKEDYDNNKRDRIILVVSANNCINGIPWAAIYPVELKGYNRPECDMDQLIDLTQAPLIAKDLLTKTQ